MIALLERLAFRFCLKIAKLLSKTKITPNSLTLLRFILAAPLSVYFFSKGTYKDNVLGLLFYMGLALIDWVDGKLARLTGKVSLLGKFLDELLDRILVLLVLGSIFYAGLNSPFYKIWAVIFLFYYSSFLFITALLYEFDDMFGLKFKLYPLLEKEMRKKKIFSWKDKFLYSFINVHKNSLTKFCFTVSYPLFLGIVLNQLIITFCFITAMQIIRSLAVMFIIYLTVKDGSTNLALIKTLKGRLKVGEGKLRVISQISQKEDKSLENVD